MAVYGLLMPASFAIGLSVLTHAVFGCDPITLYHIIANTLSV